MENLMWSIERPRTCIGSKNKQTDQYIRYIKVRYKPYPDFDM